MSSTETARTGPAGKEVERDARAVVGDELCARPGRGGIGIDDVAVGEGLAAAADPSRRSVSDDVDARTPVASRHSPPPAGCHRRRTGVARHAELVGEAARRRQARAQGDPRAGGSRREVARSAASSASPPASRRVSGEFASAIPSDFATRCMAVPRAHDGAGPGDPWVISTRCQRQACGAEHGLAPAARATGPIGRPQAPECAMHRHKPAARTVKGLSAGHSVDRRAEPGRLEPSHRRRWLSLPGRRVHARTVKTEQGASSRAPPGSSQQEQENQ